MKVGNLFLDIARVWDPCAVVHKISTKLQYIMLFFSFKKWKYYLFMLEDSFSGKLHR